MSCKVIGVALVDAPLDLVIVVVQCLPLNVLVLPSQLLMAKFQIHCSLLVPHWFYLPPDLVVVVPLPNGSPSQDHLQSLPHSSAPRLEEGGVDGDGHLGLGQPCHISGSCTVRQGNYIPSAIFEP